MRIGKRECGLGGKIVRARGRTAKGKQEGNGGRKKEREFPFAEAAPLFCAEKVPVPEGSVQEWANDLNN